MALKRVETGLFLRNPPYSPKKHFSVSGFAPIPPRAYFLDCLLSSWWDKAFNICLLRMFIVLSDELIILNTFKTEMS